MIDDTLLNHVEAVKHFATKPETDSLSLRLSVDERERWSVGVRSRTEPHDDSRGLTPSEQISRSLSLQRIVDGYGREYIDYRLGSDGVVRRWDGGDMTAKRQQQRELGIEPKMIEEGMSTHEAADIAAAALERLVNETIPNARFEEAMGFNLQPVGLAEMEGLEAFLMQPGFEAAL